MVMALATHERFSNHENQQEADILENCLLLRLAILASAESKPTSIA
jgi:hypothetical protein